MTTLVSRKRRFLFWGLLLVGTAVVLPMRTEFADALGGGPDGYGYGWTDVVEYDYAEPTYTLGMANDDFSVLPIGFDFVFYGNTFSSVTASSDGCLHFDGSVALPADSLSLAIVEFRGVCPFYSNLNFDGGGTFYYETTGVTPNRVFVAEWEAVPHYSETAPYYYVGDGSFQAKLFELDGAIEFHYEDVEFGDALYDLGAAASVGIVDAQQGYYLEYSHDSASLADGYSNLARSDCE